jgi:hypothetical protein
MRGSVADWHSVLVHAQYSIYEQAEEKGSLLWASGSYASCFGSSSGISTRLVFSSFISLQGVLHLSGSTPPSVPFSPRFATSQMFQRTLC